MYYKNISKNTMSFYGVIFKPNETHFVNGCINHKGMVLTSRPVTLKDKSISPPSSIPKKSKTVTATIDNATTVITVDKTDIISEEPIMADEKPKRKYNRSKKNDGGKEIG